MFWQHVFQDVVCVLSAVQRAVAREVDENCVLLCYYAASSGNSTTTRCVITQQERSSDDGLFQAETFSLFYRVLPVPYDYLKRVLYQ